MSRKLVILLLLAGVLCALAPAADRLVPSQYGTIQGAISASSNGDRVIVSPGTYYERIDFSGKAITVMGTNPASWPVVESTVINGGAGGSVVTFNSGEGSSSILDGLTLTNGYATTGGGIYIHNYSSPTIRRCYVHDNSAQYSGGGLYAYWGAPTVENCRFVSNSVGSDGGAMNVMCSGLTARDCLFTGNSANNGGAVLAYYCDSYYGRIRLSNCTFSGNSAQGYGGAYYNYYSEPIITNCILWDDSALYGSEIHNYSGTITVTYSDVEGGWGGTGNTNVDPQFTGDYRLGTASPCRDAGDPGFAAQPGETDIDGEARVMNGRVDMGADELLPNLPVHNLNSDEWFATIQGAISDSDTLNGHVIEVNPGTYYENINFSGKAVTVRSTDPANWAVVESTIIDGSTVNRALYIDADVTVAGFTIRRGVPAAAPYYGGGIYVNGCDPIITHCLITENSAGSGAGIFLMGPSTATISNCRFMDNAATGGTGGAIFTYCAGPTVSNCLIYDNTARDGGAAHHYYSNPTYDVPSYVNCTFSANAATSRGGAFYNYYSTPQITNCILWADSAVIDGAEIYNNSSTPTVAYSDVAGGYAGTDNINADPQFAGEYRLIGGSPCWNAGDPAFVAQPGETDIDGEARVMNGRVDIGADEVYYNPRVHNLNTDAWFETIQGAINDSGTVSGHVLEAIEGTYNENVSFAGKNVTLRSTDPSDPAVVAATIINGGGTSGSKGVTFSAGQTTAAVLDGFTVTNAHYGVYCASASPTITRCVITGTGSYRYYAVYGSASAAVVSDCVSFDTYYGFYFTNNSAVQLMRLDSDNVYYGILIYSSNGSKVSNCVLHGNSYYGLYVYNSNTVVENTVSYANGTGIRLYNAPSAVVRHCTLASCTSYGIWCYGTAPTITNCIVWNCNDDLYGCAATYSCIQDGDGGVGNTGEDPLFEDAPNADFRIPLASPCVDTGTDVGVDTDIDGVDRLKNLRASTLVYDMGAYECVLFGSPKNVLFFIGDGMGFEQVTATRYYLGASLTFEELPYQAGCTTHSANSSITDSAAAGTALATAEKVNNQVISVARPANDRYAYDSEMLTLLEDALQQGKSVGLVTTSYLTDATPAAFGAHEPDRDFKTNIAYDYLNQTLPNVLFGGGANGLTVLNTENAGYFVATTAAGFDALDTSLGDYVSVQFGTGILPYKYDYIGTSYPLPFLDEMVQKAIELLEGNPNGFFLMVEGGLIDKACHDNGNPAIPALQRFIHETIDFSESVQAGLNWAAGREDTLVLVTADHETGGLHVLQDNGAGQYPTVSWSTGGHTGANVPVYAWGKNAELVDGTMDNTDMFNVCIAESGVD